MIEPRLKPSFVRAVQCAVFAGDGDKWRFYVDPWTDRRYKTFGEDEKREAGAMRLASNVCPKCGGETATQHTGGDDSAIPETFVRYCLECDWRGAPE